MKIYIKTLVLRVETYQFMTLSSFESLERYFVMKVKSLDQSQVFGG